MRFKSIIIVAGLAALATSTYVVIADDTAAPSTDVTPKESKLFEPYNLLNDLTDDQKSKIEDIHKQELEAEKTLKQKEADDITALLTDTQKQELADASAKTAEEKKAAAEENRAKAEAEKAQALKNKADQMGAATSQPSN